MILDGTGPVVIPIRYIGYTLLLPIVHEIILLSWLCDELTNRHNLTRRTQPSSYG